LPHLWPTGSSSGWPPSITARYFSSCPSDSTSRWTPCPPGISSGGSRSALVCFRLSPSCPFRSLHTFHSSRPARNYPRFWIQRSSFERRRDFNPPDQRAAQRTLWASPTPLPGRFRVMSSPWRWWSSHRPTGSPRLLDCSIHARCPQPPRKVRWLLLPVSSPPVCSGFILVGGLATFVFLSRPNRVYLRYGSRVCLPSRSGLFAETPARLATGCTGIYMVNTSQFTRSARLTLVTDRQGAVGRSV